MPQNLLDLSIPQLEEWLAGQGLRPFVLQQILQWVYRKRVDSFAAMSNVAQSTRGRLAEHFTIGRLEVGSRHHSAADGSTKYLFRLADRESVESVLMPQRNRLTLCISSQVGCAMGCRFCKTAEMKLVRNLTQGEILGQIIEVQRELPPGEKITNIVMMGMGEPLHNYDAVSGALALMSDPRALAIGQRKITVSTVGLAPEIERFGSERHVKLALSLNATTEEGRRELMPITRKYSLDRVLAACREYARGAKHRRVTFEYVMMKGVNDTLEDARRLVKMASSVPCKINLIPYNPYPGSPYQRPEETSVRAFFEYLAGKNLQTNIRYSKGLDIMGACGQLCTAAR